VGKQLGAVYELRYQLEPSSVPLDSSKMRCVDVPSLAISISEQRYEPLRVGLVRFQANSFTAEIQFDEAGLVIRHPGIATRP
jgi:hypothetical protein